MSPSVLLIRPDDHLLLAVSWSGLRLAGTPSGGSLPMLVAGNDARLLVSFPPQHLAEEALGESGLPALSAPVPETAGTVPVCRAQLSAPSRLAVRLPAGRRIAASVTGLLEAIAAGSLDQTVASPPGDFNTAVEVPWRMVWAPISAVTGGQVHLVPTAGPDPAGSGTALWQAPVVDRSAGLGSGPMLRAIDPNAAASPDPQFRLPLGRLDRASVSRRAAEVPALARQLVLSAGGANLDAVGLWPDFEWEQSVVLGRDMRVRLLARGSLFPIGHRAEFLALTTRMFDQATGQAAVLRTRLALLVTETVRVPARDFSFPFGPVTVLTRVVDDLDDSGAIMPQFFQPMRGGRPVLFDIELANRSQPARVAMPLIFVADLSPASDSANDPGVIREVAAAYGQVGVALKAPSALDLVGAATPLAGDVHEVHALTVRGSAEAAEFVPQLSGLRIGLPAVRSLLGDAAPREVRFSQRYLQRGSAEDVLLELVGSNIDINFVHRADRSGGLMAPHYVATGLSRSLGPISLQALPNPVTGLINPSSLFGADASLLGFRLRDLLGPLKVPPSITTRLLDGRVPEVSMSWRDIKLQPRPPLPPFEANDRTRIEELTVTSSAESTLTRCKIVDFDLVLPPGAAKMMRLHFGSITFEQRNGQTPSVDVKGVDASFLGVLQLLEKLQEFVDLGALGPRLDISPRGVTARWSLPLPPVAAGAFVMRNIVFRAAISVPFNGDPVSLELAFASKPEPFVLTVLAFGGGGYVELAIDHTGLTRLEAALEFGAVIALDFVVASAEVHALGGIRFAIQPGGAVALTGYLRIGGVVDILGLVSVSVELRIELSYQSQSKALVGRATLVVEIDLTLWSDSVELDTGEWVLAGGRSPVKDVFAMAAVGAAEEHDLGLQRWKDYRAAFAEHDTDPRP
jgi:hypothetical protein